MPISALTALLLFPCLVWAQGPTVQEVRNLYSGKARLSPGVLAEVYYSPIVPADLRQLTTSVKVGGFGLAMNWLREERGRGVMTVLLPRDLTLGVKSLVLTTSLGSSAPFPIVIDAFSPGLRTPWMICDKGVPVGRYNAVGLGPTNPPSPSFGYPPIGQKYQTVATPTVTVGGVDADIIYSEGLPPWGEYAGAFRIPPGVEEGEQPVVLTMGGVPSNTTYIAVGTQNAVAGIPDDALGASVQTAAPESIVYATGCGVPLSNGVLGETRVTVRDSAGVERAALVQWVSPGEVRYIVPAGTANGRAAVIIASGERIVSTSPLDIEPTQPRVFWSTAYLIRVRDRVRTVEPLLSGGWHEEIDLGPKTDEVYLVVSATGLRNRNPQGGVSFQLGSCGAQLCGGGAEVPVQYAGPQGDYAGLEQLNVRLPRFPEGQTGAEDGVNVRFVVDGKPTNTLYASFYQR